MPCRRALSYHQQNFILDRCGYTYTPTVGGTDPSVAMEVLIINGSVREDWIPVAVEGRSWGGVKTLYR